MLIVGLLALFIGASYLPGIEAWLPPLVCVALGAMMACLESEIRNEIRWQREGIP